MIKPLEQRLLEHQPAAIIAIRRGGVDVGKYLQAKLIARNIPMEPEVGELNISFYRDDFSRLGLHPQVGPSHVPFNVEDKHILLVDDVLGTGRTVRAAMNEIFDFGRPSRITLAVLVQRSGHELPVSADVVGATLDVQQNEYVDLDPGTFQVHVGEKQ
ncbi:MAG: bifunctional pyr operon transcriptional regulator/uracil phosphoribosyltransferase PyrR [Granulosicoccus sp.]